MLKLLTRWGTLSVVFNMGGSYSATDIQGLELREAKVLSEEY